MGGPELIHKNPDCRQNLITFFLGHASKKLSWVPTKRQAQSPNVFGGSVLVRDKAMPRRPAHCFPWPLIEIWHSHSRWLSTIEPTIVRPCITNSQEVWETRWWL